MMFTLYILAASRVRKIWNSMIGWNTEIVPKITNYVKPNIGKKLPTKAFLYGRETTTNRTISDGGSVPLALDTFPRWPMRNGTLSARLKEIPLWCLYSSMPLGVRLCINLQRNQCSVRVRVGKHCQRSTRLDTNFVGLTMNPRT